MKQGVRIINCARGGLVDEAALADALQSGHVAGAALDVFETEPAKDSPLFGLENVVCTPHLGAATAEAQENVALQVAEQMADYLLTGAVVNAINMPSVTAEEAPRLKPYMELAGCSAAWPGSSPRQAQESDKAIASSVEYEGEVAELNSRPLTAAALAGVLGAAARLRQHGQRAGGRAGARHRGRGDGAGAGQRVPDADPRDRHRRAASSGASPAPCSRREAAARRR